MEQCTIHTQHIARQTLCSVHADSVPAVVPYSTVVPVLGVVFIFPEGRRAVKYLWPGVPVFLPETYGVYPFLSLATSLVSVRSTPYFYCRSIWLSVKFQVGPATLGVTSFDRGSSSKTRGTSSLALGQSSQRPCRCKKAALDVAFSALPPSAKKCLYDRLPFSLFFSRSF